MNTVYNRSILGVMSCLLALLAVGLTGCGSPSPQSFIWSGADGVAFLTWTNNQNGQLSGTYSDATVQGVQDGIAFTGQQQDASHVTLQFTETGEAMNGTISAATLQTSDATGTLTWYAGTNQQYSQIQTAYLAFVSVQGDLSLLQAVEEARPNNSSTGFYQSSLSQAQNRVKDEQASLTFIQQQSDPLTRCSLLQEFSLDYPPANQDSELQLPFSQPSDQGPQAVVDRSDLAGAVTHLSHDAKQVAADSLPDIQGLPLPWKVNPQPALRQGQQQLEALKSAVFAVAPQFPPLRAQAQQIQAQEAIINQAHQCFG